MRGCGEADGRAGGSGAAEPVGEGVEAPGLAGYNGPELLEPCLPSTDHEALRLDRAAHASRQKRTFNRMTTRSDVDGHSVVGGGEVGRGELGEHGR